MLKQQHTSVLKKKMHPSVQKNGAPKCAEKEETSVLTKSPKYAETAAHKCAEKNYAPKCAEKWSTQVC